MRWKVRSTFSWVNSFRSASTTKVSPGGGGEGRKKGGGSGRGSAPGRLPLPAGRPTLSLFGFLFPEAVAQGAGRGGEGFGGVAEEAVFGGGGGVEGVEGGVGLGQGQAAPHVAAGGEEE